MRHGEVHNPKDILYGRLPRFGLSKRGREIVKNSAEKLKIEGIDHLYSSPMLRARQTAGILENKLNREMKINSFLNEVRIIFQGMALREYREEIQPKLYNKELTAQGQETIDEIASRMEKFTDMIVRKHPGKKILAVSHGDPILILVAYIKKFPFTWDYKKMNYLQPGQFIRADIENGVYHWSI